MQGLRKDLIVEHQLKLSRGYNANSLKGFQLQQIYITRNKVIRSCL